ncbi:MAG TPA: hypothetical protein VMU36_11455 [Spirochaetia bacterium]|nr:hypothetical protein [Spirochaetia bacterium]
MATQKAVDLFKAYAEGKLASDGGYIISSFLDEHSAYSRYEIIGYSGVKSIVLTNDGLTFQTDGNKIYVLAEPPSYAQKHQEPFRRTAKDQIPHRFAELDILTTKNQTKVMVSKNPMMTYGSFTIIKPTGENVAFLVYNQPDVLATVEKFFSTALNKEAGVSKSEADKAAKLVVAGLKKFTIWNAK